MGNLAAVPAEASELIPELPEPDEPCPAAEQSAAVEQGPPADLRVPDEREVRGFFLVRNIFQPRKKMFAPLEVLDRGPPPVPFDDIDCERRARTSSTFKNEKFIFDAWDGVSVTDNRPLSEFWAGEMPQGL